METFAQREVNDPYFHEYFKHFIKVPFNGHFEQLNAMLRILIFKTDNYKQCMLQINRLKKDFDNQENWDSFYFSLLDIFMGLTTESGIRIKSNDSISDNLEVIDEERIYFEKILSYYKPCLSKELLIIANCLHDNKKGSIVLRMSELSDIIEDKILGFSKAIRHLDAVMLYFDEKDVSNYEEEELDLLQQAQDIFELESLICFVADQLYEIAQNETQEDKKNAQVLKQLVSLVEIASNHEDQVSNLRVALRNLMLEKMKCEYKLKLKADNKQGQIAKKIVSNDESASDNEPASNNEPKDNSSETLNHPVSNTKIAALASQDVNDLATTFQKKCTINSSPITPVYAPNYHKHKNNNKNSHKDIKKEKEADLQVGWNVKLLDNKNTIEEIFGAGNISVRELFQLTENLKGDVTKWKSVKQKIHIPDEDISNTNSSSNSSNNSRNNFSNSIHLYHPRNRKAAKNSAGVPKRLITTYKALLEAKGLTPEKLWPSQNAKKMRNGTRRN
ncbi:MAG: hypothetical protein JSS07_07540 [Proteobacteria bacterium]|nr:hypothetical protein [Pseudomonadota bacterium]